MANFAFGSSGALPNNFGTTNSTTPATATTPVARALNNSIGQSRPNIGTTPTGVNVNGQSRPNIPVAPVNQPIKSHTVTSPDGTVVSQTYHPPTPGLLSSSPAPANSTQNPVNPNADLQVAGLNNGALGTPGPTPTAPVAPTIPTYAGLLGSLITAANSTQGNIANTNEEIKNLRTALATDTGGLINQGGELNFQTGRIGALQTQEAAKESALQQELANEIAAKGQQIGGIESAVGAAKPEGAFPFVFNPTAGTFSTPGGGAAGGTTGGPSLTYNPQTDAQSFATAVMNHQISYDDALKALSYAGPTATGLLSAAVIKAGGNPTNLQSEATGTAGVLGTIPAQQAANTAAKGIADQITSYLAANPTLNPSDLAASNALQQWAQGQQLTDPRYQTLIDYLSEYTNTLAPVLGVGGDPTNLKTEIATNFVNARASGGSIADVLKNIGDLADKKIQNLAAGAKGATTPTAGGGGSFVKGQTAAGGALVWDGSKWVVSK